MVVIGAGGFAKELLEVLTSNPYNYGKRDLFFFDDISDHFVIKLFNKYRILKSLNEVEQIFNHSSDKFCIGIGNPIQRNKLSQQFIERGGNMQTIISSQANIGSFGTSIGIGTTVIGNAVLTNNVSVGEGSLIYMNTSITHDVVIGKFVEISPGVSIAGRCTIGSYTSIGIGASIIPDVKIGIHCQIGAGSVVINDIPDYSVVVGVPGKVIKTLPKMRVESNTGKRIFD